MSQKTIVINSANRESGNINDFYHTIDAFTKPMKEAYVESVQFYNTSQTVNTNNCEACWQLMTAGPMPALITYYLNITAYGYYDINSLVTKIQTEMNLAAQNGETYTVSYNSLTKVVQVQVDTGTVSLLNTDNTLWKRLGFTNKKLGVLRTSMFDVYTSTTFDAWPLATTTATSSPQLSTNHYKINISELESNTIDSTTQFSTAIVLPNEVSLGSMISYHAPFPKPIRMINGQSLYKVNVRVYDDENNLADIKNEFSIVIVITTE